MEEERITINNIEDKMMAEVLAFKKARKTRKRLQEWNKRQQFLKLEFERVLKENTTEEERLEGKNKFEMMRKWRKKD